jgi:response regulator RpfG family c-di-GMP phosphodiesterase
MTYKILVVDDEAANVRLLERFFRRQFQVITALSGFEALELLKQHNVSLIISDQRMPGMTGIEFLKQAAQMRQHTVRIILTGYTDVNALVEAINSGVIYKYVTKPWVNEDLQQTVARALEFYETNKKQHELKLHNQRLTQTLRETQQGFVRFVADALDLKDDHAHAHAARTANYAAAIGARFGLEPEELENLSLAAYLHEAVQLGHPGEISRQTTTFIAEEIISGKSGLERVVQSFAAVPQLSETAPALRHQYEFFDGSGAPGGLSGKQIPLYSRVIAIACAYDKLTSQGLSEEPLTHDEAVESLRADSGRRFDGEVVEIFCELKPLEKIRWAISEVARGRNYFAAENRLTPGELIHKVRTELLPEILKLSGTEVSAEPDAPVFDASNLLADDDFESQFAPVGLPAVEEKIDDWLAPSIRFAEAAELLAERTGVLRSDDAYALGLFFNIGEFLLGALFPEKMRALENEGEREKLRHFAQNFGVEPLQISQWLLEACGLPAAATKAIGSADELKRVNYPPALLLRVARQISEMTEANKIAVVNSISPGVLEMLNLNLGRLNRLCDEFVADDNRMEIQREMNDMLLEIQNF